ncbi:uncharacterized protein LOC110690167 [Chenopodium quinoa]|uniref:uncharacterized protein LOC110690167 n=1 Tax=Chenopodium quinoa TaxID=63459 RepID=UPI000B77283A|nr:uncharacterized protein LOC110690167 [Chenopodium quinoa]
MPLSQVDFISDNALMAHEVLSFTNASKARRRFYAALKLDTNKAYDIIGWDFFLRVLQSFGFPPYWIHIIRQCMFTVSYQVLVNGDPSPPFLPHLWSSLGGSSFLLHVCSCMEVLSAMLRRAEDQSLFLGIQISRGALSISYLLHSLSRMSYRLWGLQAAIHSGFNRLLIYTDSANMVSSLQHVRPAKVSCLWLLGDIRHLLEGLSVCKIIG